MREAAKSLARALATIAIVPALLSFVIRRRLLGADRALQGSIEALSLLPGLIGEYVRSAFLARALAHCDRTATIRQGTIFSQAQSRVDANVYVGVSCQLGLVHLERDVLLASGVHIPSGAAQHGTTDLDRPIREQPRRITLVRVGEGTWVGSGAIVMADVGRHCVIGAGAVVTKSVPDYAIAVGVPARVVGDRRAGTQQA